MDRARQPDLLARPAATSRRGKRAKATARQVPSTSTIALAVDVGADGSLPSEFRLFVAGVNDTMKGSFLFDEEAAASVMAAYAARKNDVAIDLEHQMLDGAGSPDPTARDARGWCRLELRADGSLWAVGVTWTPDGAQRLSEKRQRYVSPAFRADPKTSRVLSILNIAITSIPATHDTPALVAASALGECMDPKLISEALDALIAGDEAKCAELLKGIIAGAAGAEATEAPAEEAPAEPVAEMAAEPAVDPKEDKPAEMAAALSVVASLSGKSSLVDSVSDIRTWRESHIALATERAAIAKREAVLQSAKVRKGCVDMVSASARKPAEVWKDPLAKDLEPKPYLLAMSPVDFDDYVAGAIGANGGRVAAAKPPVVAVPGVEKLSARELAMCAEMNIDPKTYAASKTAK